MSLDFNEIKQRITDLVPHIAADASARDLLGVCAFALRDSIRDSGILSARIPRDKGGPGLNYVQLTQLTTLIAKADPNIAQTMQPHHLNVDLLRIRATPAQQDIHFTNIINGTWYSSGLAERGTAFRGEIATQIVVNADGNYRLNGRKFYTTGGLLADHLRITALNPDGDIVWVIIPVNRAGVVLLDDWDGMGQRGTGSGTTELTDVLVYPAEVFPEGVVTTYPWGYISAATQLIHCTIESGICLAVFDDAIRYAQEKARPVKESGVTRSVDDPFVQHTTGKIAAHAHAAESVVRRAAEIVDIAEHAFWDTNATDDERHQKGVAASIAVAEAKIIVTQASLMVAEQLFEIGGASATMRKHNLDRHWRNARTHTTHDPIAYKYKAVGAYYLTGATPPNSSY